MWKLFINQIIIFLFQIFLSGRKFQTKNNTKSQVRQVFYLFFFFNTIGVYGLSYTHRSVSGEARGFFSGGFPFLVEIWVKFRVQWRQCEMFNIACKTVAYQYILPIMTEWMTQSVSINLPCFSRVRNLYELEEQFQI